MKAKQFKNGTCTISQVTNTEMESLAKFLTFAKTMEMLGGNHQDKQMELIGEMRSDDATFTNALKWEGFLNFIMESKKYITQNHDNK